MERCNCDYHNGLEEQREGALSSGETAIEKTNARDDQPDEEGADDQVNIVIFDTSVLEVDVNFQGVSALGLSWIELGLVVVSVQRR